MAFSYRLRRGRLLLRLFLEARAGRDVLSSTDGAHIQEEAALC